MFKDNVSLNNPLVVSLFHHDVYVSALYWIIGIALLALLGATLLRRLNTFNLSNEGLGEPRARTILRIAFGVIWVFDGILQFQPGMPLGLANDVVQPTIAGAPTWLQPLMHSAINLWNSHPLALATGTAWIQIGIGLALIASNARVGQLIAVVGAGWALLIWLVGNGAGVRSRRGVPFCLVGPERHSSTSSPWSGLRCPLSTLPRTSLNLSYD
jgi:hypothetical protein